MVITKYGNFNGNSWEDFCQQCFKRKYESEGYQEMPATFKGDLGIEGFTRTGKVFQCYCPDIEYDPTKLYEAQRNKVTADLKKLQTYQDELQAYLAGSKIKEWIFVTPGYSNRELVRHCRDKATEYKALGLAHLDSEFDVLIHDIENFSAEIPIVLNFRNEKIGINHAERTTEEITDWANKEIPLVNNAIKKHKARIPEGKGQVDQKVNKLTNNSVSDFLNGEAMIRVWQEKYQDQYEKFVRVIDLFEKNVEERCAVHDGNNNDLYNSIQNDLRSKLKESFSFLDDLMIDKLTNRVMADWILRCPINFD
jgi:hypothetical protein